MEPMVETGVIEFRWAAEPQVLCKVVRPRTGAVRVFLRNHMERPSMDTTTLLIIIVVLLLLGGGWFGRGRWY